MEATRGLQNKIWNVGRNRDQEVANEVSYTRSRDLILIYIYNPKTQNALLKGAHACLQHYLGSYMTRKRKRGALCSA
jgi:hypothetical protein